MKYNEIMKYDAAINEKAALGSPAAGPPTSHHGVMRWSVLIRIKWPTSCGCCSFRLFGNHRPRLKAVSCEGMSLTRSWTKGDASCRKSEHERNEILMNIKYKKWILWILFSMFGWITPLLSQIKFLLSRRAYHLARPAICGLCFRVPSSIQTPCHPCVFHQWTTEPQPGQRFLRLFCVCQANFETTCDDTGGATTENTLQDVTSVARKGPNLLLQGCLFCIMLKLLGFWKRKVFAKF